MPYPPELVAPMREEAKSLGCTELTSADEVHARLKEHQGTALVFVNSVCGCAAGGARPGLGLALEGASEKKPQGVFTVFAGQDLDATAAAREYFAPYQPTSPQMGLLKDGKIVWMLQRHEIEGRQPQEIASDIQKAFDTFC